MYLLELSLKEIQNSLSFVGFGEITLGGVERGTERGMVEGVVYDKKTHENSWTLPSY